MIIDGRQSRISRSTWLIGSTLALLVLIGTGIGVWDVQRRAIEDASVEMRDLGTVLAEQTSRYVQLIDLMLQDAQARSHDLGIRTPEEFRSRQGDEDTRLFLNARLKNLPQVRAVSLFDADGVLLNASGIPTLTRFSVADRDYFQHNRDHDDGGVYISAPLKGRITGIMSIYLARRISGPDGRFLGIALVSVDVEYLLGLYRAISTERRIAVSLLRRDGVLLARNPTLANQGQAMPKASDWFAQVARGGGTYRTQGYFTGIKAMVSVTPLPDYPLVIDVTIRDEDVLKIWWPQAAYMVGVGLALAGAIVALSWMTAGQMRRQAEHNAALLRASDALREAKSRAEQSESQLRDAVDSMSEGFVIFDHNDGFVVCNDTYRHLYAERDNYLVPGARFEDILRHVLADGGVVVSHGRESEWLAERLEYHREPKGTVEQLLANGTWIMATDRRMKSGGLAGLRINITAQKEAQAALLESEARLDRAQAIASVGSWELELATGRAVWSKELYRIRGVSPEKFEPNTTNGAVFVHPDDYPEVQRWLAALAAGIEQDARETRNIRPDGEERLVRVEGRAITDPDGVIRRLAGTMQDITARRLVDQKLVQAQKMEAIGNLTGGMAHDFNNSLGVIIGNLDLLGRLVKTDATATELCDEARDGALRCADRIRLLLAFARQQTLRPRQTDVNALTERTAKLLTHTLGDNIAISLRLGVALPPVVADQAQLEAALTNLANNARDAMPGGGFLDITTKTAMLDEHYASLHPDANPGTYVLIEITDSGTGIAPEIINRVFEPFFTTKEAALGTGLGLSMVFGFVKQSGGHLAVYSEPGHGSTFRIYLPHARTGAAEAAAPADMRPVVGGNETVLVVEDNAKLRQATARQLAGLGYKVVVAEHAAAALVVFSRGEKMDLLFTDMVMPGTIDGLDLAHQVTQLRPGVKVLLTSGFPGVRGADPGILGDCPFPLLSKPYGHDDLARTIRAILDDDLALATAQQGSRVNSRVHHGDQAVITEQV